ncbi:hypothetical protein [Vagococcus salmoninarum]|uniref:hypothetical protein n=1 Tax=Vagococcus salmoninarum TaxID=2739 RepID=UPI00187EEBB5|nr:hypothetical protein [Vagococcus salmoninarum]MBE9387771.1 hypothetical protein [Vagococcus salmoninarum]
MNKKILWTLLLFVTCWLFILGLRKNQLIFYLSSLILAYWVQKKGSDVLFEEYNERKARQKAELTKMIKDKEKSK